MAVAVVTFSSLFEELKTEALNKWEALKSEAAHDVAIIAANLGPVVSAEAKVVLSQFKAIAIDTVVMLARAEFASLSGAQKNSITANTIMQSAVASGKTVLLSDAASFAQDAFDALNGTKP